MDAELIKTSLRYAEGLRVGKQDKKNGKPFDKKKFLGQFDHAWHGYKYGYESAEREFVQRNDIMQSDTPITDAATRRYETLCGNPCNGFDYVEPSDMAALERDNARLREALRENLISGRIIKAENSQRGQIYAIERDAKFIIARTESVLSL